MKQIKVNESCSGCGLCIANCAYLEENEEGNAQPVVGKVIKKDDEQLVKKVIKDCPEHALTVIETGTSESGKEGLSAIINTLKNQCESFSTGKVSKSDVRLNIKNYHIKVPYSSKDYSAEYGSFGSARSAARDEFNRLCYSSSAYNPILKKVFVEYKVNVLKPYYDCSDHSDSAYYKFNSQVRQYLADAYAQVCDILGEDELSESWKNFSVYPDKKDWNILCLSEFDERSTSSGIITELKSISRDYVDYIDVDYYERYMGEGLFGNLKMKKMYYFSKFDEAAKRFIDDLTWSINLLSSDIEEGAVDNINAVYQMIEQSIKEEFMKKIDELTKTIFLDFDQVSKQFIDSEQGAVNNSVLWDLIRSMEDLTRCLED